MNELWREAQKRDDFAMLSVAVDMDDTMPRLRKLLRTNHVHYPVLHYTVGDIQGLFDWNIDTLPTDLLIDPQGNIIRRTWADKDFLNELKYYQSRGDALPKISLELSQHFNADKTATITVVVSNTAHSPLDVEVGGWWGYVERRDFDECMIFGKEEDITRHVEFDTFGDYSFSVNVPVPEGVNELYYYAVTTTPGTVGTVDENGLAIITDRRLDDLDKVEE